MHVEVKPFHIVGRSLPPLVAHMLLPILLSLVFLSCHICDDIHVYVHVHYTLFHEIVFLYKL